ncbi:MAG: ADP-ribosylglycohydrolase family protein [Myxococcaceae bacterium]|nr:ADP-ribosylglycohydrolase family protein [Myxococcaceae bacterium]
MPLRLAELQDRLRASMLGFAIGDALGFPLRGLPPPGLTRLTHVADDFAARPRGRFAKGQFSDDTQMMLATAEAVTAEKRIDGRSVAAHLSWLWQEGVILQPPTSASDAAQALLAGTPWMGAGAAIGVRDPSCLSRALVLGFWSEPSPPRLAHDAQVLTVVTHKDPLCAAAASAFARAVQLGLSGEPHDAAAFCAEVSKAAAPANQELADELYYLPRALSWAPDRALPALRRVGVAMSELEAEGGLPAHVTPVLLTALYCVLKAPADVRQALTLVLSTGGEVDVAAGLVGAIIGAHVGTEGLPARLRRNVLYGDSLVDAADRLFDARLAKEQVTVAQPVTVRR